MDTVEITVEGYFNIIVSVLKSIAFVFQGGVVAGITAGVALLYFLILIFRSSIDSKQPNPFAELILICILGLMFVGGTSVKLTVQLTQKYDLSSYAEVQGVPMLIALPYYFANRATDILKDETKRNFLPIELASFDEVDPLQAISKLYYQNPPRTLLNGGNNALGGYDLQKTINNYFTECVKVDNELNGAPPTSSISAARKQTLDRNFFTNFEVAYDGISTTTFLQRGGSEFGFSMPCPDAYAAINNELNSKVFDEWVQFNSDSGLSNQAVAKGLQMITGAITNGSDAYDIQAGLFAARMVREGLVKSGFETELDMMIFQGQQQRMFQKLGERSMFENITKPVITLFELLIFFLTPIYTILLALGSKGLAHVAKYFMLIIFVSLWSYMNIFIDVFTYYIIEETVNVSSAFNPLSFDDIPITMSEVESAVATSAAAAQSVPFLLMFLMYGGVHSLMGAMRGLTDVKANGNFGAPSITSPANNGSRDVGNVGMNKSVTDGNTMMSVKGANNDNMQTLSAGSTVQTAGNNAVGQAQQRQESDQQAFNKSFNDLASRLTTEANSYQDSEGNQLTAQITSGATQNLSSQLAEKYSMNAKDADAVALSIAAGVGVGMFGDSANIKADLKESNNKELAELYSRDESGTASLIDEFKSATNYSEAVSSQLTFSEQEQKAIQQQVGLVKQDLASLTESTANTKAVNEMVGQSANVSSQASLNLTPYTTLNDFDGQEVLQSMLTRDDDTTTNQGFKDFLNKEYGTSDFDEIKAQGHAPDKKTGGLLNDGNGSDAGVIADVLGRLQRNGLDNIGGEGANGQLESRLEALRRGADSIAGQGSDDLGSNARAFSQVIEAQEKQFETLLSNESAATMTTLDGDATTAEVKAATSNNQDAVNKAMVPQVDGTKDAESQAKIANLNGEAANVQDNVDGVEDKNRQLAEKVNDGQNKVDVGTGAPAALLDTASRIFGEGIQDFQYANAQESMYGSIKQFNADEMASAKEEGRTPNLMDSRMFNSLDETLTKATSGNGDFTSVKAGDLATSYMAIETISQNRDALIKNGLDEGFVERLENAKGGMDNILSPSGVNKSDAEKDYTFKTEDDYQAFRAISSQVANGEMEASSGLSMTRELVGDNLGEAGFFSNPGKLVSENGNKYELGNTNIAYDQMNNAGAVKETLNKAGITSFDGKLDSMANSSAKEGTGVYKKVSQVDRNEDALQAGDATFAAANYAYSQRSNAGDLRAGEASTDTATRSAGADDGWFGSDSGYDKLLKAYDKGFNGTQGDFANLDSQSGSNEQMSMYRNNASYAREVASLYGGSVESNLRSETQGAEANVQFSVNSDGVKEIDRSMIGSDGKLNITSGNYSPAGRRMSDGEDIGELWKDKGSGQYMSVEYGKMKYYNEDPNKK